MNDRIEEIKRQLEAVRVATEDELETFRMEYISKKSVISGLFTDFRELTDEGKREYGPKINALKNEAQSKFKELIAGLKNGQKTSTNQDVDPFLPVVPHQTGSLHPLNIIKNRIIQIFERQGFNVAYGPEIEDDWHNFTALNFPENHPAREMQDTYFIQRNPDTLLRTHTSNVQVRLMRQQKPPIRSIMPGRVFRNEAISARAHCFFHQVEGLYINERVSFKDLKQTLFHFAREMFGKQTDIRFRPSFFPFTEPSAEIDISCFICGGSGCKICKQTGWVEIGGSGMVDPNVLEACEIDPDKYSGFAFGMGIERIVMLKYQIDDLRLFSENDLRFLRQFH